MKYIIGIDEVGRGALAGPVVVAGVMVREDFDFSRLDLGLIRDSKKLSVLRRLDWCRCIKDREDISVAIAKSGISMIEKLNISGAANAAAARVFLRLTGDVSPKQVSVILDGGLYLGRKESALMKTWSAVALPQADEDVPVVSAASIVAKVIRDSYMIKLGRSFPEYGFERHKGYGTKFHMEKIWEVGLSRHHRLSFVRS